MTNPDAAFIDDQMCFACGRENPVGLKLTFRQEGEAYVTTFTPPRHFQGYQGIVHGGIVATLLDEVMARLVWLVLAAPAATARLEVRYRRPAPVGVPIEVRGWITEQRGERVFTTAAEARLADGTLLAEATALVMRVPAGRGVSGKQ